MATFTATAGTDNLVGSAGATTDIFNFTPGTANAGDKVDGRGGADYIQASGGAVDFTALGANFTSIEGVKLGANATAVFDIGQLGGGVGHLPTVLTVEGAGAGAETFTVNMSAGGGVNLGPLSFSNWSANDMVRINGSGSDDTIIGSTKADVISAGGGNDTIRGGAGDDTIDGGAGSNSLFVSGGYSSLTSNGTGWVLESGDGRDTITNIQVVSDGTFRTLLVGSGGFTTIQAAVNAARNGDTILVANGDYTEQVTIANKGDITIIGESQDGVVIHAPAASVQTGVDPINGRTIAAVVTANTSTNIVLQNLTVDGDSRAGGMSSGDFVGIAYLNASGVIDHVTTQEFRDTLVNPTTVSGNQRGTDILSSNAAGAPNSLEIAYSVVQDFQKTGILARNTDVYIHDSEIHGFGPQTIIAQNGIQLSSGSTGQISDNSFDGLGFVPGTNSVAAILAFSAHGVVITGNGFAGTGASDLGVYLQDTNGATISGNEFDGTTWGIGNYGNITTPSSVVNAGTDHNTFLNIPTSGAGYDLEPTPSLSTVFDEDGGGAGDYMTGAAGNDSLRGNGGDDALLGNGGNDTLAPGAGADYVDGGAGVDTVIETATLSTASFSFTGGDWHIDTGADGADEVANVEVVTDGAGHTFRLVGGGGYAHIQDAVDAASAGDFILIAPGTYTETHTTIHGTAGLYINTANLTLQGYGGALGQAIATGAEAKTSGPTVISGAQNGFGANHWVDVGGDNVTINGLHLQAGESTNNKLVEVWADGVSLTNNYIDVNAPVAGYTYAIAVYINDDGNAGADEVSSYTVSGNVLNEGVYLGNGVGDGASGAVGANQVISNNRFEGHFNAATGEGRYDTIASGGNVPGTPWLNESVQFPTAGGNVFGDNSTPFILRGSDADTSHLPSAVQVASFLASNGDSNTHYAYALTSTGELATASRNDGGGDYHSYAVTNTLDTLNLALDNTPDAVFGGRREYVHSGDTVVVQSGDTGSIDSQVMVDNLTIRANAHSADLDLTLAETFADGSAISGGVHSITLADYALGQGASVDVTGNSLNNTIIGNSAANTLSGGGGDDHLTPGGGADHVDGGAGTDTVSEAGVLTADDISFSGGAWHIATATEGTDEVSNVEVVTDGSGHTFRLVGGTGYATIQEAIDHASNGDIILLAAGEYNLSASLSINKSISILGANHGLTADDGARSDESVLKTAPGVTMFTIGGGNHITIDGVQIDGASVVGAGTPGDVFTLENSVLNLTNASVPNIYFGYGGGYDFTFTGNQVNSTGYSDGVIFLFEGGVGHVTNNTFNATGSALTDHAVGLNLNGISGEVSGNLFSNSDIGVLVAGTAHDLSITDNTFSGLTRGDTSANGYAAGILLFDPHYTGAGISISDNSFENSDAGIRTSSYNSGSVAGLPISIDGNVFDNNDADVVANASGVLHLTDNTVDAAGVPSYYVGGPTGDSITGGGGVDLIEGRGGDDSINAGAGDDTIDGGAGVDTLVLSSAPTSTTYNSGSDTWTIVSADGTDTVKNIEVISGGGHSTVLVGPAGSIQAAINAAAPGDTILIAAGTYRENVNVNKAGLTLVGLGEVTVQGTFLTDNGVPGALHTWLETTTSYNPAAGDGVTISANGVTLNNLNIEGFLNGIRFAVDTANTTFTGLDLAHNVNGIEKSTTANIDGLTITGGTISDGYLGVDFAKAVGVGNEADGVATQIVIDGTSFSDLSRKGIYVETLDHALLDNIVMNNVGQYGSIQPADSSAGRGGNGINLNLKAGTYSNIVIEDFHLTNTGASDKNGTAGQDKNGGAIVIEARNDGGTYGPAPAVVTDTVTIRNGTIDGHTSTGIQVGEPGKANVDPDVDISNVSISGAAHTAQQGDLANESQSTVNFTGVATGESIVTSELSSGRIDFTGGGGNDSFTGHGELNVAHFAATLGVSSFTATGSAWSVNAGAEGVDTLAGVEQAADGAGHHFLLVGSGGGYATLQAAVNAASEGDTILVGAGVFTETVTITKGLNIVGMKHGIDGAASGRGVATGTGETTLEGRIVINTTHDVAIDGLRFLNDAAAGVNGSSQPAVYVMHAGESGAGHQILNSVFYSTVSGGAPAEDDRGVFVAGSAAGEVTVSGNYFTGSNLGQYSTAAWGRGIWSDGGAQTLNIDHNTFQSTRSGINLDGYNDASSTVANNSFLLAGTAISVGVNATGGTFAGVHDNLFQTVDLEFNLQNLTIAETLNLTGTNNLSGPGQFTTVTGSSGADTITGTTGDDYLFGRNGADSLKGGAGNDNLDGGDGIDTAVYAGTITAGMISTSGGVTTVTTGGAEGTDTLVNIEFIDDAAGHHYSLTGGSPVSFGAPPAPQSVTEDTGVSGGNLTASTSGSFTDLDPSDTHTVSGTIAVTSNTARAAGVAAGLVEGTDYQLVATVNEAGRTVGYSWTVSNSAVNALSTGDTITLTAHETISDGSSTSSEDVVLTINGHNDAPTTSNVTLSALAEDGSRTITTAQLLANANDVDTTSLSVSGLSASSGTVTDNHDGTWTYVAASNFSGAVTFNYNVSDGDNSVPGTASLSITPVSDTPTLATSPASGNENGTIPLSISSALTDTDGSETLSVTITGVPSGASLSAGTNNGGGSWTLTAGQLSGLTMTPPSGFNGDFTLHVTATATDGPAAPASAAQDLAVHVVAGTGGIAANTDSLVVTRTLASSLSLDNLLANDTGGVGALSVTGVSNATGGTVSIVGGRLVITASAASGGFDYTVTDTNNHVQTGHANFTSVVTDNNANSASGAGSNGADLQGQGGNDTLVGSAGLDRLVGGAGNDTYTVDSTNDLVIEALNEGTDTVNSSATFTLGANVENLTLTGSAALTGTGNELDNTLTGNAGASSLYGLGGADKLVSGGATSMYGGAGDDTYYVDHSGAQAFENSGEGADTVRASVSYTLGVNVENLALTGTGNISGTGNTSDNAIVGNNGANTLTGLDGADNLQGGAGDDVLDGGIGADKLTGGTGIDQITGGAGADLFYFTALGEFAPAAGDVITDFSRPEGDKIHLIGVDANTGLAGDQAFSFIGAAAFSGSAGQLRCVDTGSTRVVSGDVNGDGVADFSFTLLGTGALLASDFYL